MVRIGEELVVLVLLLGDECLDVFAGFLLGFGLFCIEHGSSAAGTHDGNLGRRPSIVQIGAELLATHHNVAAAIRLAECDGNLGHGGFTVSIE